jgi:dipeptidyl aminopeptidase/acylaminoacyl peptidase
MFANMRWWRGAVPVAVWAWLAVFTPQCWAQRAAQANRTALPGPEVFYRQPDIETVALSPSGRWLAMTTGIGGARVGLAVFDLQSWKVHALAARFVNADISDAYWVNDESLIFSIEDRTRGGSNQRFWPGLYSVSRNGGAPRLLVDISGDIVVERRGPGREPLSVNHALLHVPRVAQPDRASSVIVGEARFTGSGEFSHVNAKWLNTQTGMTSNLSYGVPDAVQGWMFDADSQPRLLTARPKGRVQYYWREGSDVANPSWKLLGDYPRFELPYQPRFIGNEGDLYVSAPSGKEGESQLHRFDFATGKPHPEPLVSTPGFDFNGRIVSETPGSKTLGVRVETDAETTVWFDARLKALQAQADARWPGTTNRLDCRRCEEPDMTVVMQSWSDRDPGQVWVYRAADTTWRKVGDKRQDIQPAAMATTDFTRIRARDGLEFPVWLTVPAGAKAGTARPAVVLVHGGPWVRGRHWRWSSDAQFLASRGYVVIEPEFRGSTGYGQKLYRAGWRQFGQAMQDDVADALAWAVKEGWVDKNKVCIAGASYGGYATLMGLAKHPELYRCGVAWVALTDPLLMYSWRFGTDQSDEVREVSYPTLIGDPVKDLAMIEAHSPVKQAARIRAPVMMAFGTLDRRVLLEHGKRMRGALTDAGNPPLYVEYPDEGHGWFNLETRLDFARRMEAFLAQHLKD